VKEHGGKVAGSGKLNNAAFEKLLKCKKEILAESWAAFTISEPSSGSGGSGGSVNPSGISEVVMTHLEQAAQRNAKFTDPSHASRCPRDDSWIMKVCRFRCLGGPGTPGTPLDRPGQPLASICTESAPETNSKVTSVGRVCKFGVSAYVVEALETCNKCIVSCKKTCIQATGSESALPMIQKAKAICDKIQNDGMRSIDEMIWNRAEVTEEEAKNALKKVATMLGEVMHSEKEIKALSKVKK